MYQSTVEKFIKAVGEDEYIPCSSIASAEDMKLLSVIERKASKWWHGKDKHYSTEFTFSDVTAPSISTTSVKTEPSRLFVEFKKTSKLDVNGKLEGHFREMFGAELDNSDKVYVNAPVGGINIVEVEHQSLLDALKSSKLDLKHQLIKELATKPRRALCVVVGILNTASECTLTASLDVNLNADVKGTIVNSGGEISSAVVSDRSRELKIPAGTALAYQVLELAVDKTGSMQLMLTHDAQGGFENCTFDKVDGSVVSRAENLPQEYFLQPEELFAPLSRLSAQEKKELLDELKIVIVDEALLIELYHGLNLKKTNSQSIQRCIVVVETQSARPSMLALARALRDLSYDAQNQVAGFLADSSGLADLIVILSSTYSGKPKTVKKPLPERVASFLTDALDFTLKEVDDSVEVQTNGGVFSPDARSAYVALCGIQVLRE